ncbi:MAG: hypothetical protein HC836_48475, partial [Richelia sp. RM2_1_2]|nr:hypothetical protein [Richelia sp. RM2_1_2]
MGAMSAINKAESLKRQRDKKRKEKQAKSCDYGFGSLQPICGQTNRIHPEYLKNYPHYRTATDI